MSLTMIEPKPHPRSGVYRVRLTIPKPLRETAHRLYGFRAEFIQSLHTKDKREALKAAPAVLATMQDKLRALQDAQGGRERHLSDREISALCGRWLADQEARTRDSLAHPVAEYEEAKGFLTEVERDDGQFTTLDAQAYLMDRGDLPPLLASIGAPVDRDSLRRLVARLANVKLQHAADMLERARTGRWDPTITSKSFAPAAASSSSSQTSIDALLDSWGLDRGWSRTDKPISRNFYDRLRTLERLADFLGHRDAGTVSKADVGRWKAEMQGRDRGVATIRNDLSEMSAIWTHGVKHGLVEQNPFAGLLPPKSRKRTRDPRAFTIEEARTILLSARQETGWLRWLPYVLCFTGARLNEVCQPVREDVMEVDGVTVLRIHDEGEGRSLKTEESRRLVPIHPALRREGFLDYVAKLPAGSPLWPDMKPDTFGRRSGTGGRKVSQWLREDLKLTDAQISPSHSWRHLFIDLCRRVVMPLEVRSAITGHSGARDESAGYGEGMRTMVQIMAEYMAKVPGPLDPPGPTR